MSPSDTTNEPIRWLLVDYGEVVSLRASDSTFDAMAQLANLDADEFRQRYWRGRQNYDLGQSDVEYWSDVLGRDLSGDAELVRSLTVVDVEGWSRLNEATLAVLTATAELAGLGLALLSNAPEAMALAIECAAWSRAFAPHFFSCRLGLVKPHDQIYRTVLAALGVPGERVVFIDDREENTQAAAAAGIRTIHFSSVEHLTATLADLVDSRVGD